MTHATASMDPKARCYRQAVSYQGENPGVSPGTCVPGAGHTGDVPALQGLGRCTPFAGDRALVEKMESSGDRWR